MFPYWAQKMLGWYGGFPGTMGYFTDTIQLPWPVAFLISIG